MKTININHQNDFGRQRLMHKATTVLAAVTLATFGFVGSVLAAPKDPSANVIANAECLVSDGTSDKDVMVTAILEQKEKIGPAPEVGVVTFILEQHIRNQPKWGSVAEMPVFVNETFPFDGPAAGDTEEVADHTFLDICASLDPDANAIRGVVEVEVTNSNDRRNTGKIHTGRCISLPNPCL